MIFWVIYLLVVFASLAMMVREGLWSNTITLINVLVSGLAAFGFYSPLALMMDEQLSGQLTYVLDFVCLWLIFVVTMLICRLLTGLASRTRMRFKYPIDMVGGPLVGLITAWVLASFVTATLHTAPMPKDAFSGKLVQSDVESASALTSPDAAWLRFVELVSLPQALGSNTTDHFTASGFVKIYQDHRGKFEKASGLSVRRG
jgi:Colicin V production protein